MHGTGVNSVHVTGVSPIITVIGMQIVKFCFDMCSTGFRLLCICMCGYVFLVTTNFLRFVLFADIMICPKMS